MVCEKGDTSDKSKTTSRDTLDIGLGTNSVTVLKLDESISLSLEDGEAYDRDTFLQLCSRGQL